MAFFRPASWMPQSFVSRLVLICLTPFKTAVRLYTVSKTQRRPLSCGDSTTLMDNSAGVTSKDYTSTSKFLLTYTEIYQPFAQTCRAKLSSEQINKTLREKITRWVRENLILTLNENHFKVDQTFKFLENLRATRNCPFQRFVIGSMCFIFAHFFWVERHAIIMGYSIF